MWVFGYGSLMWDGWERDHACTQRIPAELPGYSRIFNKKSVERWGTRTCPGLTLNLERSASDACRGMAFAFQDNSTQKTLDYLAKREACEAHELPIRLEDCSQVSAHVYIYEGRRLIGANTPLEKRASMIVAGEGTTGSCYDYLTGIKVQLAELGIVDSVVEGLWGAVSSLTRRGRD
jgi:glutathione-specific gamma-glutamylcyclotransferase